LPGTRPGLPGHAPRVVGWRHSAAFDLPGSGPGAKPGDEDSLASAPLFFGSRLDALGFRLLLTSLVLGAFLVIR